MKTLILEDEQPKLDSLLQFFSESFPDVALDTARSVKSGITKIEGAKPEFLILDMSLPTFDIGAGEPGGRPQGFGGKEVLRHMKRRRIAIPTVIVTAYSAFSNESGSVLSVADLSSQLKVSFPDSFLGLVQFDPIQGTWGPELAAFVRTRWSDQ